MDDWQIERERKREQAAASSAQNAAEATHRKESLTPPFEDKKELIIAKVLNFVGDYNKKTATAHPEKRLEFKEIDTLLWRITTITTYLMTHDDGTRKREFPELDIKFNPTAFTVTSRLLPVNSSVILQLEVLNGTPMFYQGKNALKNGAAIGALLAPFLEVIDPIPKN